MGKIHCVMIAAYLTVVALWHRCRCSVQGIDSRVTVFHASHFVDGTAIRYEICPCVCVCMCVCDIGVFRIIIIFKLSQIKSSVCLKLNFRNKNLTSYDSSCIQI